MNIIYTGAFRFPEGDAAAPRVLNNAKILRDLGHSVIFISWGGCPKECDKGVDGNFYYQGFRYMNTYDLDIKRSNLLKRIFYHFFDGRESIRIIKKIIADFDLVIGYNPSLFFTYKMLSFGVEKVVFVSDITEWFSSKELPGGRFAPPYWANELNMRFMQKFVRNKILISKYLNDFYHSSNNIILPPLVDSNEEKWINFKTRITPFDGLRLIYAGTPTRKDLLATMLTAVIFCLKININLQFIVLGVTIDDLKKLPIFKELTLFKKNIILYGVIPQTEVPAYYKASDFSLIVREKTRKNTAGFPTKLAESMMSGCPVLLNYTSDISNYVQNGINGLIMADWTAEELQKVILQAAALSASEKEIMKFNALKSAMSNFEFSCYHEKMEEFIKKIVK